MANSLSAASPLLWSRISGRKRFKSVVYKSLASSEEQATLTLGVSVDRPYRSNLVVEDYTTGGTASVQDITATSDKLTINKQKDIFIFIDAVDKLQNKYDLAQVNAEEMGKRMAIAIDAEFLYEAINANNTIDAGDMGGTAGTGLTLSTSNVGSVFAKINRKLDAQNVPADQRFLALSPQFREVLWNYVQGKESIFGDKSGEYGQIGMFGGLELYLTNNLTASAVATPAVAPTANDTITIGGVVFTFVDAIGTTAGNVLVNGGTVAQVITRLTTLINAPGTTTSTGVAFSGADLRTVQNMVAVDGTTILTVYQKGVSYMTVASSAANIVWSKKKQHNLAGAKNAIDVVVQKYPDVSTAPGTSNGKAGTYFMALEVFGVKTFNQGKNEIVNVVLDTSDTTLFS